MSNAALIEELKSLIIEALNLEDVTPADIETDAPLFNEGLGSIPSTPWNSVSPLKRSTASQLAPKAKTIKNTLRASPPSPISLPPTAPDFFLSASTIMVTEQQIFDELKKVLTETFEIEADKIVPNAKIYEDLDIDSIDAVDLLVKLQPFIGTKKITPAAFKSVRTIGDLTKTLTALINGDEAAQS